MIAIKAQYAMEFMLVFAFSLIIIMPLIVLINSEYNKSKSDLDSSQAKTVLDEISIASQDIYYAGYPSRTTLELYFPSGIANISSQAVRTTTGKKSELVFIIRTMGINNTILTVVPFNLSVSISKRREKKDIDKGRKERGCKYHRMRRAQYSMEFLIFFAILSIVFFGWLVFYAENIQEMYLLRDRTAFQDIGKSIQKHITLASNVRSGYYTDNLFIPDKVNGKDFTLSGIFAINTSNYIFYMRSNNQDYIFQIPYTIGKLKKGQNKIWNLKGVVAIGDYPPIERPDGTINYTQCSDGMNNDIHQDIEIDFWDLSCGPEYIWQDDDEACDMCQGQWCPPGALIQTCP